MPKKRFHTDLSFADALIPLPLARLFAAQWTR